MAAKAKSKAKGNRTKKGNVTTKARAAHGTIGDRYPVFDMKSARSALKLLGHGNLTREQKLKVIRAAAKYLPEAAAAARKRL
jgi:hypothetical protein